MKRFLPAKQRVNWGLVGGIMAVNGRILEENGEGVTEGNNKHSKEWIYMRYEY